YQLHVGQYDLLHNRRHGDGADAVVQRGDLQRADQREQRDVRSPPARNPVRRQGDLLEVHPVRPKNPVKPARHGFPCRAFFVSAALQQTPSDVTLRPNNSRIEPWLLYRFHFQENCMYRVKSFVLGLFTAAFLLLTATLVCAQGVTTASITGLIKDGSGGVVP